MNVRVEACRLTTPLRSAVATVAVRGSGAADRVAPLFQSAAGTPLQQIPVGRVAFGRWRQGGEELVVCRTAPDQLEIHCHGGRQAARRILDSLEEAGVEVVAAEDWLPSPGDSPAVNAALKLLAQAPTRRTAAILLDQTLGAWDREAHAIQSLLDSGQPEAARPRVQRLEQLVPLGRHLVQPWRVLICGAPNVGKSTLMNRLLGYDRSVVWNEAGTTRDLVSCETVVNGWPLELTDTAGLRDTRDEVEREGTRRASQAVDQADLVLEVLDAAAGECLRTLAEIPVTAKHLLLLNKIDRQPSPPWLGQLEREPLRICAVTGAGLKQLISRVERTLVPERPGPGAAVPVSDGQRQQLLEWAEETRSGSGEEEEGG